MHLILLFNGLEGAWYLFTYFVVQAAIAAFLSWRTVSAKVAADEGVIYTAEPIVAPLVFGAGYCFLLYQNARYSIYVIKRYLVIIFMFQF